MSALRFDVTHALGRVALADLRIDPAIQQREALDDGAVADYAAVLIDGAPLPPISVVVDGSDEHWLVDGFHRVAAAKLAGVAELTAELSEGSREDAIWASCGANANHGVRRTNADKRRAVTSALRLRPEAADREIARHCGVSHPFVGALRAEIEGRPRERPAAPGVVTVTTPPPATPSSSSEPPRRPTWEDVGPEDEVFSSSSSPLEEEEEESPPAAPTGTSPICLWCWDERANGPRTRGGPHEPCALGCGRLTDGYVEGAPEPVAGVGSAPPPIPVADLPAADSALQPKPGQTIAHCPRCDAWLDAGELSGRLPTHLSDGRRCGGSKGWPDGWRSAPSRPDEPANEPPTRQPRPPPPAMPPADLPAAFDPLLWLAPQPAPVQTERSRSVTDAAAFEPGLNNKIRALLDARRAQGIERYGVELQSYNGRDPRCDQLQEAVDGYVYAVQEWMEAQGDDRVQGARFRMHCWLQLVEDLVGSLGAR